LHSTFRDSFRKKTHLDRKKESHGKGFECSTEIYERYFFFYRSLHTPSTYEYTIEQKNRATPLYLRARQRMTRHCSTCTPWILWLYFDSSCFRLLCLSLYYFYS